MRARDRGQNRHDSYNPRDAYNRNRESQYYSQGGSRYQGGGGYKPRESLYDKEARKLQEKQRKEQVLKEGVDNEEEEMMKMMGFGGFETTKNKSVQSNKSKSTQHSYKPETRKYRQYMNRKGGFNRPLDHCS